MLRFLKSPSAGASKVGVENESSLRRVEHELQARKISSLDSIRGLASLAVVFWHFMSVFFPAAMSGHFNPVHSRYDILLYRSPVSILFAGNFAVLIFFILSGFVLTVRFMSSGSGASNNRSGSLFPAAAKRYFRLMPVALVSIMIAYLAMALGLFKYMLPTANLSGSGWIIGGYYFGFHPNFVGAILQGLAGIFTTPLSNTATYNPALWTLYYELLGSFLVFGMATLIRGYSRRWIIYVIAIMAFVETNFIGFIVGLLLADIYVNRSAVYEKLGKSAFIYKSVLLLAAIGVASYPAVGSPDDIGKYWKALTFTMNDPSLSRVTLQLFAGTTIIMLALSWTAMRRVLEHRALVWLGKVSFSLYAVHFAFLYAMTTFFFIKLTPHLSYVPAAFLSLLISLPILFVLAALLHKYVELPSIIWSSKIGKWAESERSVSAKD